MLKTSEMEPMCEIWKIVVVFHEKKSYCRTAASECWSSAKLGKNSSNPDSYMLLSGINISWGLKSFRYSRKQPRIPKKIYSSIISEKFWKSLLWKCKGFCQNTKLTSSSKWKSLQTNFWNMSSMKWIFPICWWYILSIGRRYQKTYALSLWSAPSIGSLMYLFFSTTKKATLMLSPLSGGLG